jgi:hypothetical protein
MRAWIAKAWWFVVGAIRDPNSLDASSARICGLMLISSAIGIAVYGAIQKSEHAATIATLTATGTGMIGLRAKSDK